ncbi:hypothetical protein [Pigmentiphaga litoralis]|uniref:hypothetical protein n=1 Tax=Pigmentiphaga litoralis TaxID=516702 RepID=UPI003B437604
MSAKLNKTLNDVLATPAFREELAASGGEPLGGTAAEFATFRDAETAKWGEIVKASGIKLD